MQRILWPTLLAIQFIACDSKTVASDTHTFQDEIWEVEEPVSFELPQFDSLENYNVFLTVRNTNDYPFSNLFLIVSLEYPFGKTVVDTLEYNMAAPDGTWLGAGIGNIKDSKLYYKENFQFTENGNYILNLKHAVRNNGDVEGVKNLEGITDVGYSIERIAE